MKDTKLEQLKTQRQKYVDRIAAIDKQIAELKDGNKFDVKLKKQAHAVYLCRKGMKVKEIMETINRSYERVHNYISMYDYWFRCKERGGTEEKILSRLAIIDAHIKDFEANERHTL